MKDDRTIENTKSMVDILGRKWIYECMGCSIAKHEMIPPGGLIYEDTVFTVQQDPLVPIKGFIIINVKKHVNSIMDLNDSERSQLINLSNKVITYLKELKVTEQVTMIQEERSKHLHIWIFPNHSWMDEKFGKGVSHFRDICKYAQENCIERDILDIVSIVNKLKEKFN